MRCALVLPYPPSVWKLYRGQGRNKHRSPEYEAWLKLARLQHANAPFFTGPVEIKITAQIDDNLIRDIDNIEKAILDFLVMGGIIKGDDRRYVRRKSSGWGDVDLSGLKVPAARGVKVEIETCG